LYTTQYRPVRFSEVVGQDVNIEILRSIVKDPENSPRSIILQGEFGCGKTTCARILAKALNCKNLKAGYEPCGICNVCISRIDYNPYYQEYDSSDVGSVDAIRGLKEEFLTGSAIATWKVVVFDEWHLASRQAQSALLKLLEDLPPKIFVLFCTTDVEKVINTIRSRSIELIYGKVRPDVIRENLRRIIKSESLEIEDKILDKIALYSRGHVRDSVMMLDLYKMTDNKEVFLTTLRSSELDIINMLIWAKQSHRENYGKSIKAVCSHVLDVVKVDFFEVIRNGVALMAEGEINSIYEGSYRQLVTSYGQDLFKLLRYSAQPWASNIFSSDAILTSFLWSLFFMFSGESPGVTKQGSVPDRARAR